MIKDKFELDVDGSGSSGLQDAVWSTAVQKGPGTNVFKNAFTTLGYPSTPLSEFTNKEIISAIYDERARTITQEDVDRKPYLKIIEGTGVQGE